MTTILIVEDDPDISEMLKMLLETEGYQTVLVACAEDAADHLQTHHIDLILSDWFLPGMTGGALYQALRTNPHTQSIPIIVMSASKRTELPADDPSIRFLMKPFDFMLLFDTITHMLLK